jgi:alpha-1,6-mannosyltransferase
MGNVLANVSRAPAPAPEDRAGRASPLVWSAILGAVALWAVMAGTSMNVSPFALHEPGSWLFSTGPAGGHGMLASLVLVYGGLLLFIRVWVDLVRWLAASPGLPLVRLVPVFALWVVPMLVVPPLFSKDVYSYAAQGEMVSHHLSPYVYGPGILGAGSPFLFSHNGNPLADPMWANAPTPYGPLVLWLDGVIVRLDGHSVLATVVVMRLLAFLGVVLAAAYVPRLARSFGFDPSVAFAAAILNPVTLLHLVGGSHNDALMVGLLVAGLVLAREGRPVVGIVLCTLAAAVKAPAELAVVYIGWEWMGTHLAVRERVRPVVTSLIISGAVMALVGWVSGLGWGWLGALSTPGTVVSMVTPTTLVGTVLSHLAHAVGLGVGSSTMLALARALGLVVAFGICVALLGSSDRIGSVRAIAISLLAVVILGPVVQPWYMSWGLILAATVATGRLRKVFFILSVAMCFLGLPGAAQLLAFLTPHNLVSVAAGVGMLLLVLITPLKGWVRRLLALRASAGGHLERLADSGSPNPSATA